MELKDHALQIRRNIIKQVYLAQSGHIGGSLSAVEIVSVLYFHVLDIHKENIHHTKRDRFVLSKGHASPLLYATLYEKGFLNEDLSSFRKINSKLQGHPNMQDVAGVDMSSGSLGQGLSVAVGMALANRLDDIDARVYTLLGDGECQEGQVWEAAMAAAHYHLDQLCVIVDHNKLQIDGRVEEVMNVESLEEKFKAFGFYVQRVDGHNIEQLKEAFQNAQARKGRPTAIIAYTIKGKGVSFMEDQASWHGTAPNQDQYRQAMKELGGDVDD